MNISITVVSVSMKTRGKFEYFFKKNCSIANLYFFKRANEIEFNTHM